MASKYSKVVSRLVVFCSDFTNSIGDLEEATNGLYFQGFHFQVNGKQVSPFGEDDTRAPGLSGFRFRPLVKLV